MKRQKKINKKRHKEQVIDEVINRRFYFYVIIMVLLFLVIIVKLYSVMLINNNKYKKELKNLSYAPVEGTSTPRGRIYDRNYNIIVDNKAVKTIIYKNPRNITTKEKVNLAYTVSSNITLSYDKVNIRNLKEFYIAKYPSKVNNLITKKEWKKLKERKLTDNDIDSLKIARITEEELNKFSDNDRKAAYLYYLMNKGYTYDEKIIKDDDVTDEEYAYIATNNKKLVGFNTKLDWERVYPNGDVFKSMLGTVSTTSTGIPKEEKDEYLAKGYSLNDRVGISYIEKEYEEYLKGKKEKYQVINRDETKLIEEGSRGQDIVLSIDINFQKELENILAEQVLKAKTEPNTNYYDHSFVVIQEPSTGEIIAMAGKQAVKVGDHYEARDYTPAILTSPMTPGSVVKGASMLVGYNTGAVKIGEYMIDECVKIAGTPQKCSSKTLGRIDDIWALAKSSNVYQFKIAMRVAGINYTYGTTLPFNQKAFDTYRAMYHSFGLGVKTEIDLPVESTGYSSKDVQAGNLLDFVMGQYETYTPIQLSQYINTIAEDGKRLKPHLLKEVRSSSNTEQIGSLEKKIEPTVLNTVDTKPEYMARVKEGFHAVTHYPGAYGRGYLSDAIDGSGKTGTSQSFLDTNNDGIIDTETISSAFIGYAPTTNPRISIVVTSPDSSYPNSSTNYASLVTMHITKAVTDKYFEMYP